MTVHLCLLSLGVSICRDSWSWHWQKLSLDCQENLNTFKKLVSMIENLYFVSTPPSIPKSLYQDREICWDMTFLANLDSFYWSWSRVSKFYKDAGFVYESFRNETNLVIWEFYFSKTNPQYESLRLGFANLDLRIQSIRILKDSDLRISIFKDSFCAIVLRICKDSLDSLKQV
jgi:hypothetical protein